MIGNDTLQLMDRLGFGADIDSLENRVAELQDAAANGEPLVDDAVYDTMFRLLKEVKPESEVLNRNFDKDFEELSNTDELLKQSGMCSILTIQNVDELRYFEKMMEEEIGEPVDLMAAYKENGYGVRCVWRDGEFVEASTRGRYKKGRDITRHLSKKVPAYVDEWSGIPLVEVRGELIVKLSTFYEKLSTILKTPLSAVTSLSRESATDEEIELLSFVGYKVIFSQGYGEEITTLKEEYDLIDSLGMEVPSNIVVKGVTSGGLKPTVNKIIEMFGQAVDAGKVDHYCDGVVISINDKEIFNNLGRDGNTNRGNFAAKMGRHWECNVYSAIIEEVIWVRGKKFLTPKARVAPTVVASGAEVKSVPLYNVGVMERHQYYTGETIYFRFGGETGVTTCDALGNSVREEV